MPILDFQIDVTWLSLIATVLLPALVGLVTKRLAHPGLKAGVLGVLALITGLVNDWLANDGIAQLDVSSWLATSIAIFAGAVLAHYGFLKPAAVTGADGQIQISTATIGLGGPRTPEAEAYGDRAA